MHKPGKTLLFRMLTGQTNGYGSSEVGGKRDMTVGQRDLFRLEGIEKFKVRPPSAELEKGCDWSIYFVKFVSLVRLRVFSATYCDEWRADSGHGRPRF